MAGLVRTALWTGLLLGCGRDPGAVDVDQDGWYNRVDCNDQNALVHPGVPEVPGDGVDNDCNPMTDDADLDQDGVLPPWDCEPENPSVPGIREIEHNGLDDDCDPYTLDDDLDGDGFTVDVDCDDRDPTVSPASPEIPYDGLDNDCSFATPDDDLDGDGVPNDEDCDDQDTGWNTPVLWWPDCDADGFAPAGSASVEACSVPLYLPPDCVRVDGTWTRVEPVGEAQVEGNTSVDCNDDEERAYPRSPDAWAEGGATLFQPWDYDCNGLNEALYGEFACIVNVGSCITSPGYDSQPACGEPRLFSEDCVLTPNGCAMADPVEVDVVCQ